MIDTYRHKGLRKKLIKDLQAKGISDQNVLRAINSIPRHQFVESTFQHLAYDDIALRINENQTISQPYTVAYQTQMLDVQKGMKVLEIGTGSAYQACILAELGAELYTIERFEALHQSAKKQTLFLGYDSITCIYGDGFLGHPEKAPFDRIIITAAAPGIPDSLINQLAENGKMVVPVNNEEGSQVMLLVEKKEGKVSVTEGKDFKFVPMLKGVQTATALKKLNN